MDLMQIGKFIAERRKFKKSIRARKENEHKRKNRI